MPERANTGVLVRRARSSGALPDQAANSDVCSPSAIEPGTAAEEHRADQRVHNQAGAQV